MTALDPLLGALAAAREGDGGELVRLATVTGGTSTTVSVRFDGESVASARAYRKLYAPAFVGDRVVMLRAGTTWVAVARIPSGVTNSPDTGWIEMSLQNGWTNLDPSSFDSAAYRRLNGMTILRGMLNGGTRTGGTVIANIEAGFRPSLGGSGQTSHTDVTAGAPTADGSSPRVNIRENGDIAVNYLPATSWISFTWITFPADA